MMGKIIVLISLLGLIPSVMVATDVLLIRKQIRDFYKNLYRGQILKMRGHGSTQYKIVSIDRDKKTVVCSVKKYGSIIRFNFSDIEIKTKSFLFNERN